MTDRLELMAQVVECEACALHTQCTAPVFMSTPTTVSTFPAVAGFVPKIAILGEAPGEQEDIKGKPFIGPAGEMLRGHLKAVGIDPDSVSYVNAVSCYPHGTPEWEHVHACAANREAQLALSGATHVLCVGKVATKSIEPALELKHGRARPFLVGGRVYFATYHPAAALRNGNYEQEMADDIRVFAEMVQSGPEDWLNYVRLTCSACPKNAGWIQESGLAWCLEHLPSPDFAKAQARVERNRAEYESVKATQVSPPTADDAIIDRDVVAVGADAPETSKAAAAKALPRSGSKRREVYEIIKASGGNGMTDKELEAQTGTQHESVSAIRNGLMKDKQIFDSGQRRLTPSGNETIVWVVGEFAPVG